IPQGELPFGAVGVVSHWSKARFDQCETDRKSTRLNSSHLGISYAVFCLKTGDQTPGLQSHRVLFFGHLDLYILIIPVFGIISTTISAASNKSRFGYLVFLNARMPIGVLRFVL